MLKTGVLWLRENPTTSTAETRWRHHDGGAARPIQVGVSGDVRQRFRSQRAGPQDHVPGPGLSGAASRRLTIPMHAEQRLS
jgi:hypothetical protein